VTCHHPVQLLALLQFLSVEASKDPVDLGVNGRVDRDIKAQHCQNGALNLQDLVFVDEPLALSDHLGYFRRVDLVHLASNEQAGQSYLLVILLIDLQLWRCELVEDGDGEVLAVLGHLFVKREDPFDGMLSILIIDGLNGIGGGVSRLGEGRHGGALVQEFR